jgi:hypothetical protein
LWSIPKLFRFSTSIWRYCLCEITFPFLTWTWNKTELIRLNIFGFSLGKTKLGLKSEKSANNNKLIWPKKLRVINCIGTLLAPNTYWFYWWIISLTVNLKQEKKNTSWIQTETNCPLLFYAINCHFLDVNRISYVYNCRDNPSSLVDLNGWQTLPKSFNTTTCLIQKSNPEPWLS